jgi:membrane-associated protein
MMDLLMIVMDFILHIDTHLQELIAQYGAWVYAILFLIVFCETGLIVMPFLPGDSLLFAAGAFAASGSMELVPLMVLLMIAAILGDAVNYAVGNYLGPKALTGRYRFLKPEYLQKTQNFYDRYGGKTLIIARFVPIVRTFAPFLAGVGGMPYRKFAFYNITGAVLWVISMTGCGYLFGNIPFIRENFSAVVLGIIVVSLLPAIFEVGRNYWQKQRAV